MSGEIEEVIERLEHIVSWARGDRSRAGYFAAMYCAVTKAVKQAIADHRFEDGARMEKLDVVFATRYLDAFEQWRAGGAPTAAWGVSFDACAKWRPIIVQQLLTGMNAHINLDLGIAAATVAPGDELPGLHRDFDTINEVLSSMVDGFMKDVQDVSPWIKLLDKIGGRAERHVINFSIDVARDESWAFAQKLAPLPQAEWPAVIAGRDDWTAGFGRFILQPGRLLPIGLLIIRLRETNDVDKVIDLLFDT